MPTREDHIEEIMNSYNYILKPLLAQVETEYERIPLSLFNELRSMFDHIARCFLSDSSEQSVMNQMEKATRHLYRVELDCYKNLILYYHKTMQRFERHIKHVDIKSISNGQFCQNYYDLREKAITCTKQAKLNENSNSLTHDQKILLFSQAVEAYSNLHTLIFMNYKHVDWARVRYRTKGIFSFIGKALLWLLSIILTIILTCMFSQPLQQIVKQTFG